MNYTDYNGLAHFWDMQDKARSYNRTLYQKSAFMRKLENLFQHLRYQYLECDSRLSDINDNMISMSQQNVIQDRQIAAIQALLDRYNTQNMPVSIDELLAILQNNNDDANSDEEE